MRSPFTNEGSGQVNPRDEFDELIIKPTNPVTHTVARLFAADPIDVLKVLELSEDMEGVSLEAGLCTSREGREETDLSFKIDKKIQLSAPTKQLFPRKC